MTLEVNQIILMYLSLFFVPITLYDRGAFGEGDSAGVRIQFDQFHWREQERFNAVICVSARELLFIKCITRVHLPLDWFALQCNHGRGVSMCIALHWPTMVAFISEQRVCAARGGFCCGCVWSFQAFAFQCQHYVCPACGKRTRPLLRRLPV